jgi:hypothetical protein
MKLFSGRGPIAAAYLVLVILFAVYLRNADRVYYALSGQPHAVKLPDDFRLPDKGYIQFFNVGSDFLVNTAFEEGKIFLGRSVRVLNERGGAQLRVFLRSADALYEVVEKRPSFWVESRKRLTNFFIPTSGLKDGVYQLGLFLSDDHGARFAWIASFFEKRAGGPVVYTARPVASVTGRTSDALKFHIGKIEKEEKAILFQGWAVLENADMSDYNAFLKIEDSRGAAQTYCAPLYTRMNMASRYHDPRAADSGFRIKVTRDALAPGTHSIKVVVRHRKTGEVVESAQTEIKDF